MPLDSCMHGSWAVANHDNCQRKYKSQMAVQLELKSLSKERTKFRSRWSFQTGTEAVCCSFLGAPFEGWKNHLRRIAHALPHILRGMHHFLTSWANLQTAWQGTTAPPCLVSLSMQGCRSPKHHLYVDRVYDRPCNMACIKAHAAHKALACNCRKGATRCAPKEARAAGACGNRRHPHVRHVAARAKIGPEVAHQEGSHEVHPDVGMQTASLQVFASVTDYCHDTLCILLFISTKMRPSHF